MKLQDLSELDFIPMFCGHPVYPGGWPMKKESIYLNNRTVYEIEASYYCQSANDDELRFLKEYAIYHIFAPVFDSEYTDELRDKIELDMALEEILILALEYGMDPL